VPVPPQNASAENSLFGFRFGGSYRTKTVINDTELLRQYSANHSEEAFAVLVQRYLNLVYFAALRRTNGDTHLAEDVTQRVFAALAADAVSLQRHAVLTGWLYVTTRHAAANAMRSEQRRLERDQEVHAMQENQTTPDLEADWNQLRPQLDGAIDELSEPDRLAVLLRYFENRPFAEIGAALRVSEDAARVRVDRALDKLRALLVRRGITSTAAALGLALSSQSALAAPPALAASVTGFALTSTTVVSAMGVGGASSIASVLTFMSTTKTIITATSVLAALALGTAVYEVRATYQAQAALAASTQEIVTLRDSLQREAKRAEENEKKFRSAEALAASLQKSAAETETAKKAAAQSKPAGTVSGRSAPSRMDMLLANPDYQELNLKLSRNSCRFRYGPLYQKLGLSTQQITDFEVALDEQQQVLFDTANAARAQGLSPNEPGLGPLIDPTINALQDKLRAVLGDAGYAEYKAYRKTAVARASADSLASALYYTASPLTAEQADQLTQVVVANTRVIPPTNTASILNRSETDWEKVSAEAKTNLSSIQFDALQAVIERERMRRQMADLQDKLTSTPNAALPGKTSGN
jgi:RNA polymerase sigma factor (sigma-70 family)